jgi:hypothetical protein
MPGAATPFEVRQGDHRITTAAAELDLDVIHGFLTASYWSPGIDRHPSSGRSGTAGVRAL